MEFRYGHQGHELLSFSYLSKKRGTNLACGQGNHHNQGNHKLTPPPEDSNFVEIVAVTPKLNDRKRREISIEGNNSQANPGTETHNETIKEKLFGIPMGGSTRKSKLLIQTIRAEARRYLHPK